MQKILAVRKIFCYFGERNSSNVKFPVLRDLKNIFIYFYYFTTMSINKVILIGNVGKDPDVRYLENNLRVANFPLATTERGYTMSNGTQVPDRTDWHTIVLWRSMAETAERLIRKGTQLYVEGKLKTRSYEDKSGIRRYVTEIYAENIQILNNRRESQPHPQPVTEPVAEPQTPAEPAQSTEEMPPF